MKKSFNSSLKPILLFFFKDHRMLTGGLSSGASERPSHMLSLDAAHSSLMRPSINMRRDNPIFHDLHFESIQSARSASTSSNL